MKISIKYNYKSVALTLCLLTLFSSAWAQTPGSNQKAKTVIHEKCLYHFDDLQRKQTWTESYNSAGLHFIDFKSSSYIEAYMNKNSGPLVKYYESDNSFDFGLRTASYTKINKTTFYGKIDYNNFRGKNMTNSGLVYPERYLLQVADDVPGKKLWESYELSGGLATELSKRLLFGFQVNYEAGQLAKVKDLRHKTRHLDFEVTSGLIYRVGNFNIGANYYYRKFHEKVEFSKISDEEKIFTGYVYKGLWYGLFNRWNISTLILERPFTDVVQGGSFQIEYQKENLRFLNELTYKVQDGLTGPGADKAYSQNEGEIFEYKGVAQYEQDRIRHYLKVNTRYTDAVNYDKVYNQERIGGIYVVFYYGLNKTHERRTFDVNAEYELALGKHKCAPEWNFTAGYNFSSRSAVSSLVHPYYFSQDINITAGYGKINKNFLMKKGMVDLSFMGAYSSGSGTKQEQHVSSLFTGVLSEDLIPSQRVDLLNREYEFLTKGKFIGEFGVRISKFASTKNSVGSVYLDAKYSFTTASDIKYHTGSNAGMFSLALGYSF